MSARNSNFVEDVQKLDTLTAGVTTDVTLLGSKGVNPINALRVGALT